MNTRLIAALSAVVLTSGCQVAPVRTAQTPYPQRDLTVLWAERVYWSHPDGLSAPPALPTLPALAPAQSPDLSEPVPPVIRSAPVPRAARAVAMGKRKGRLRKALTPQVSPEPPAPVAVAPAPVTVAVERPEPVFCVGDRC
ncbi:MAG: hypothetical protein WAU60_08125 [Candidatus Competibacter denitrificans]|jgi:hypothetical protein